MSRQIPKLTKSKAYASISVSFLIPKELKMSEKFTPRKAATESKANIKEYSRLTWIADTADKQIGELEDRIGDPEWVQRGLTDSIEHRKPFALRDRAAADSALQAARVDYEKHPGEYYTAGVAEAMLDAVDIKTGFEKTTSKHEQAQQPTQAHAEAHKQ